MAVELVTFLKKFRGGSYVAKDLVLELTEVYQVFTDSPETHMIEIVSHPSIPKPYSPYPGEPSMRVSSVNPKQEGDDGTVWHVEVTYSSKVTDDDHGDMENKDPLEDPLAEILSRPIKISTSFIHYEAPVERAVFRGVEGRREVGDDYQVYFDKPYDPKNMVAVTNSSEEPFEVPPTIEKAMMALTIQRNVTVPDFDLYFEYMHSVNESRWLNGDVNTWRVNDISVSQEEEKSIKYFTEVWELVYNPETHLMRVLDRGFRQRVNINGQIHVKPININLFSPDGEKLIGPPSDEPVLLDGRGGRLDTLPKNGQSFDLVKNGSLGVYIRYDAYPRKDFAKLGFF